MKRPWNAIDATIYSLATQLEGAGNMNICSYVMPVSRQPKLYAVAIDPSTYTYQLFSKSSIAILQVLHKRQISLVRTLGKKSGLTYDKMVYLEKKNVLMNWQNSKVLTNCCAYLQIEKIAEQSTGDHQLFICKVNKYKTLTDKDFLTWNHLVAAKIIL